MKRIQFISLEQLLEMQANKDPFALVEVLPPGSFQKGHLPGAINIPTDDLKDQAEDRFDKKETVVVYCANYHCHASTQAAEILLELGFENVLDFKGGKDVWEKAGLKLES